MAGDNVLVPVYHTVSDHDLVHIKHLYRYKTVAQFVADMEFLCQHYTPVGLHDVLAWRCDGAPLPRGAMLLTFDDGLREIVDVIAPVLLRMGIPATFFLTTSFLDNRELFYKHKASMLVEHLRAAATPGDIRRAARVVGVDNISYETVRKRLLSVDYKERHVLDECAESLQVECSRFLCDVRPYVTREQVKRLIEQGFTIGAHSVDHPCFGALSLAEQLNQAIASTRVLAEEFALDYRALAFPFNDRGVSADFFDEAVKEGRIDLFFGTSSMMEDSEQRCCQRTIMETLPVPASSMLLARYMRLLVRKSVGKNWINRDTAAH